MNLLKKTNNNITCENEPKKFPHIFVILFCIAVLAMILTWIVPGGQYERILDEATGKQLVDPNSFVFIENTPINPFKLFVCIEEGLISAAGIIFLILCAFSSLYLLQETGAINAVLAMMVRKVQNNPKLSNIIMIGIMILIAVWASTGTFSWEELIAFIPLFAMFAIALGYDPLVGIGVSAFPLTCGFASGVTNPFNVGVAQTIAGLPLFSAMGWRIFMLVVFTTVTIIYVMLYARKIKKDPTKSLVYGIDYSDLEVDEELLNTPFTNGRKLCIVALIVAIVVMAYGLIKLGWYINEVAAIFMALSVALGFIAKLKPSQVAKILEKGCAGAIGAGLVVGLARGTLIILQNGNIIDTIVYGCVSVIDELPLWLSAIGMLIFQTLLNFVIPSGSGQAAISMPLMTPIADLIGLNRQIAVTCFQLGDGFSNLIWPTFLMPVFCSMAKVPLSKYYKWLFPYFGIIFIIQIIIIQIAIYIDLGPM